MIKRLSRRAQNFDVDPNVLVIEASNENGNETLGPQPRYRRDRLKLMMKFREGVENIPLTGEPRGGTDKGDQVLASPTLMKQPLENYEEERGKMRQKMCYSAVMKIVLSAKEE